MITQTQRTRNLHKWMRTAWVHHLPDDTPNDAQGLYNSFRSALKDRLANSGKTAKLDHILRIIRPGFIDSAELGSLTPQSAAIIATTFKNEGLTTEILDADPVTRTMYVVLANVSFKNDYKKTMDDFLKKAFKDTPFIETACAVFGNYDCIFTLWASQEEIQEWLWTTLRKHKEVAAVTTLTYQTYSNVHHRFDVKAHPDYTSVLNKRWEYNSDRT